MTDFTAIAEGVPQAPAPEVQALPTGLDDARALELARAAYSASTTYFDANVRPDVDSDLRQFRGLHPAGSKYHSDAYKARSRFYRPKTRATIRKNEAVAAEAFFSTGDVVSVQADDDTSDMGRASASLMQALLQYRLTKTIPWFLIAMGAYQEAQAVGVCISHQYWEYDPRKGKDKPCIELKPIENMRFDPNANWTDPVNTSPYLIELMPMYVKDVKAAMLPDPRTGRAKFMSVSDAQLKTGARAYSDQTRVLRDGNRVDAKTEANEIHDYSIVWVHRNIHEVDGVDWIFYTIGSDVLLSQPVPLKDEYFHGKRPYVLGCCVVEAHRTYPGGVARLTKDTQGEINELANQRMDNVKFALNKRYFVKRNKQVDLRSLARNVPGSSTLMDDPEADVKIVDTPDVTASSYQEQDRLNLDFDDVAGAFSSSSVQSNRRLNETVGGMNILTGNANQVGGYQLRTFVETWVEPVLRQLVLLEKHYETDEVILMLAGRSAKLAEQYGYGVSEDLFMQELVVTVNVGMGATSPHDKVQNIMIGINALLAALADGLLERYGLKVDELIKEIFGVLGYKDGVRFFDVDSEDPRVTALLKTIEQLQQQLAMKQPPEVVAATVEKLKAETQKIRNDAVGSSVEAMYSATQAGAEIAVMPNVAPLADTLLRSAGFVDQDAAPILPLNVPPMAVPEQPQNTHPMFPANPDVGMKAGIEQPGVQ